MFVTRDGLELHVNISDVSYYMYCYRIGVEEACERAYAKEKALYYKDIENNKRITNNKLLNIKYKLDRRLSTLTDIHDVINHIIDSLDDSDAKKEISKALVDIKDNINEIDKIV